MAGVFYLFFIFPCQLVALVTHLAIEYWLRVVAVALELNAAHRAVPRGLRCRLARARRAA